MQVFTRSGSLTVSTQPLTTAESMELDTLAGANPSGSRVDANELSSSFEGVALVYHDATDNDVVYLRCQRNDCSDQ